MPIASTKSSLSRSARTGRFSGRQSGSLASRVQAPVSFDPLSSNEPMLVLPEFKVTQRVFHPKFGSGLITEVTELKNDVELAVEFQRHGKKRLMASLANLEIVES